MEPDKFENHSPEMSCRKNNEKVYKRIEDSGVDRHRQCTSSEGGSPLPTISNSQEQNINTLIPNIANIIKKESRENMARHSRCPILDYPGDSHTAFTSSTQTNNNSTNGLAKNPSTDATSKTDLEDYIAYAKSQLGELPHDTLRGVLNQRMSRKNEPTQPGKVNQNEEAVSGGQTATSKGENVQTSSAQPMGVNPVQGLGGFIMPSHASPIVIGIKPASQSNVSEPSGNVKCGMCDRTFMSTKQMKRHLRNHTEFRPYKCSLCSRSFFDLNKLKRHSQTHSGLKPYECHICDQKVSRPEHLKRHLLTHSELRPYRCSLCDFTARRNDSVRSHIKSKHPGQTVSVINMTAYLSMGDIEKLAMEQGGLNRIPGSAPKRTSSSNESDSPPKKKKKKKKEPENVNVNIGSVPVTSQNDLQFNFNPGLEQNAHPINTANTLLSSQTSKQAVEQQEPQIRQNVPVSVSQNVAKENAGNVKRELAETSNACLGSPSTSNTSISPPEGNNAQLGAWNPDMTRLSTTALGQAFWDPGMGMPMQLPAHPPPRQPIMMPDGNMLSQQIAPQHLSMAFNPQAVNVVSNNAIKQEQGMNTCGQEQLLNQQVAGLNSFGNFTSGSMPTQVSLSPYFMNQSRLFLNGLTNRGRGNGKRN